MSVLDVWIELRTIVGARANAEALASQKPPQRMFLRLRGIVLFLFTTDANGSQPPSDALYLQSCLVTTFVDPVSQGVKYVCVKDAFGQIFLLQFSDSATTDTALRLLLEASESEVSLTSGCHVLHQETKMMRTSFNVRYMSLADRRLRLHLTVADFYEGKLPYKDLDLSAAVVSPNPQDATSLGFIVKVELPRTAASKPGAPATFVVRVFQALTTSQFRSIMSELAPALSHQSMHQQPPVGYAAVPPPPPPPQQQQQQQHPQQQQQQQQQQQYPQQQQQQQQQRYMQQQQQRQQHLQQAQPPVSSTELPHGHRDIEVQQQQQQQKRLVPQQPAARDMQHADASELRDLRQRVEFLEEELSRMKRALATVMSSAATNLQSSYSPPATSPRSVRIDADTNGRSVAQHAHDPRLLQSFASQATTPQSQRTPPVPDRRSPVNASLSDAQESAPSAFVRELRSSLERGFPLAVSDGRNGPVITLKGRQYSLDDATPWVSYDGKGEPYSVRAVLECVRTFDMGYMDYLTYTKRANLPRVLLVDRQKLLEDLIGSSPSQANVDNCLRDL